MRLALSRRFAAASLALALACAVPAAAQQSVPPSTASAAVEACHVFKAAPATVYSLSGYVGGAAWIMVFNATSAPVDGAVTPIAWTSTPSAGPWSIAWTPSAAFTTGIVVCASSTGPLTKTAFSTNTVFAGQVQ